MNRINENIKKNKEHYDQVLRLINIEEIINKVNNLNNFLGDAIKTDTSWHGLYQQDFYKKIINKKILELGCGDGLNSLIMAALGAQVFALDISVVSEDIILKASSKIGIKNIFPITGDFIKLNFESRYFDFIVGKAFLHHLDHELEKLVLQKVSQILKQDGEARFFEPATNNELIDFCRWIVPVPGRPSILNRHAFLVWKNNDPHPGRDNSSNHYQKIGTEFFKKVKIIHIGSIERFHRLIPQGKFNRVFRRWAHRIELKLPSWFRYIMARSQTIIYQQPR